MASNGAGQQVPRGDVVLRAAGQAELRQHPRRQRRGAANLCVCYLVTSQNEEAEELLRKLEKEEERKVMPPFPENIFF